MDPSKLFQDRRDAGRQLARHLRDQRHASPIVLGLPRGGVPVAYEVAHELGAPLDVCVVRKIGAPIQPELGIGAVSENGAVYVDHDMMRRVGVTEDELARLIEARRSEVESRVAELRGGEAPIDIRGRTVIVVDDGIATGGTARAAIQTLIARGAGSVVLAAPVGASDTIDELASIADEVVCPHPEDVFHAVGLWYEDFEATSEREVVALLAQARAEHDGREARRAAPARQRSERVAVPPAEREVRIPVDGAWLRGTLAVPIGARGLVLFAHGSGSSRRSSRNRYVAEELQRNGIATLLFDLLTEDEDDVDRRTARLRFDIALLARRLEAATEWVLEEPAVEGLRIGYFGASTGAAAAFVAAARNPTAVRAIVSRGGRPDLAEEALVDVRAPTLLVVGGDDPEVLRLNREALYFLACVKGIEVVSHATHLFEEAGALERVATVASQWFVRHLGQHAVSEATG
jgi:putative phosphoribosyl transferase